MEVSVIVYGMTKILQIVLMNIVFETHLTNFKSSYITFDCLDRTIINGLIPTKYKIEFLDVITKYSFDSKTLIIELELTHKLSNLPKESHTLILRSVDSTINQLSFEYDTKSDDIYFVDLESFYKGNKIQIGDLVYCEYTNSMFSDKVSIPNHDFFVFLINKYDLRPKSINKEDLNDRVLNIARDRNRICSDIIEFISEKTKWMKMEIVHIGGNSPDKIQLVLCYNRNIRSNKKYVLKYMKESVQRLEIPELTGKYIVIDTKQISHHFYILLELVD